MRISGKGEYNCVKDAIMQTKHRQFDSSMDKDDVIEGLEDNHQGLKLKSCKPRLLGINGKSRRCLSWKKSPSGEEWSMCYTYFMVQIQVPTEEDWVPHGAKFLPERGA